MTQPEDWIDGELDSLRERGLLRCVRERSATGGRILDFSSNDYLDLAHHPVVIERAAAALKRYGTGATASRLMSGTLPIHTELEDRLAHFKGYPACLVFPSGYMTNIGVIPAIVGKGEHLFIDRLSHASIVDGGLLSRAHLHRFRHNDAAHLDELLGRAGTTGRRMVVTESVFSMDGDLAPLTDIVAAAQKHGAMIMVDEAHATGSFGTNGAGLVSELGLQGRVDLSMGTLSKALAASGGFVACSKRMRELLVNRARSFIYSTGLSPAAAGAALGALDVLRDQPDLGVELLRRAESFRRRLADAGLDTGKSASQIVPVMVGDNKAAVSASERLAAQGIIAAAVRPPTVPEGTARLRLSVTLAHTAAAFETAVNGIMNSP